MSQELYSYLNLRNLGQVYYNLSPAELVDHTIRMGEGVLADSGALVIHTGEFTGRSPKDKYVVREGQEASEIWWGDVNHEYSAEHFDRLYLRVRAYMQRRDVYIRDCYACADPKYRLKIRVLTEKPWQSLFAYNMFIRPPKEELKDFVPDFTLIAVPGFYADPVIDFTRQHNFTILNFPRKIILIGGSAYTGEIKKSVFSVLNFLLPHQNVLPMHCSANVGAGGDVAVFFGLSGTGKTTLSADPNRGLIGDDEHGWTDDGVFNFEGGCYAKCINLTKESEPDIWNAIKFGALLENTRFYPGMRKVDFADKSITENTRVSYPLFHVSNAVRPSVGGLPQNIFLLTADAFGVLPPISKLTPGQAMYHFLSGYTAKVAGTEAGVVEPQPTFSACFGQAFLPMHPTTYADMLGQKMKKHQVSVWMVNTGWTGGSYGTGSRIKLAYTRAMITAAIEGKLNGVAFHNDPVFGLAIPENVPGVPSEVLVPRNTWADKAAFDATALKLARFFNDNFARYSDFANDEIKAAAPKIAVVA